MREEAEWIYEMSMQVDRKMKVRGREEVHCRCFAVVFRWKGCIHERAEILLLLGGRGWSWAWAWVSVFAVAELIRLGLYVFWVGRF